MVYFSFVKVIGLCRAWQSLAGLQLGDLGFGDPGGDTGTNVYSENPGVLLQLHDAIRS